MQTNSETGAAGGRGLAFPALAALGAVGLLAACATAAPGQQAVGQAMTATASGASAGTPAGAGCAAPASAAPAVPAVAAIQFTDPSHGWAAGAGRIVATSDGGRTWTRQYSGPAALSAVDFTDRAHGWAVGAGTVLRTTDGGSAWTALPAPRVNGRCVAIGSVYFVSPAAGYAIAAPAGPGPSSSGGSSSGGELLRTTDGGVTWTRVAGAPAGARAACFGTAQDGYLGTGGRIWRTTDAGATWQPAFTEPPVTTSTTSASSTGASAPAGDIPQIQCAGTSGAWVLFLGTGAAMMHSPYLAYATANGTSWHGVLEEAMLESAIRPRLHLPDGPGSEPGPFSVISEHTAAFVGYTPPANGWGAAPLDVATSDGAKLTSAGDIAAINEPLATAFVSTSRGWVVGENLRTRTVEIEATSDAGRSWTTQYTAS